MSGHSKWNNIKRKKGAADAERGKIFTKIGREIQVAVKSGGPDPDTNTKLKDIITKAKSNNMPNDNIQRSINKASGAGATENYEEIVYEGYGPSGVAVMVRTLTDNRNRTAGEIRHTFDRNGGNLGTSGCVAFMFSDKGHLAILREAYEDEEQVMLDVLEAGAEDFEAGDEVYEIVTDAADFENVRSALAAKQYRFEAEGIEPTPENWVSVADEKTNEQIEKLIDMLEDNDDVQEVFHNWER